MYVYSVNKLGGGEGGVTYLGNFASPPIKLSKLSAHVAIHSVLKLTNAHHKYNAEKVPKLARLCGS